MRVGALVAVAINLYVLVISLSDLRKSGDVHWISVDMLPNCESEKEYRFQLVHRINLQLENNANMTEAMKTAVACILGTLLADMCVLFYVSQATSLLTFALGDVLLPVFIITLAATLVEVTRIILREIGLNL